MPRVIYINGPSSVGKSTLTRALQNALTETYLRIGIDQMIGMMPTRLNDWSEGTVRTAENRAPGFCWNFEQLPDGSPAHHIMRGPEGVRISDLFHTVARTMLLAGYSIIIDDVALRGRDDIERWQKTVAEFPAIWVGLTAPLSVLEERERTRGDRALGSSGVQASLVHAGNFHYDCFFDTANVSLQQMVHIITTKISATPE